MSETNFFSDLVPEPTSTASGAGFFSDLIPASEKVRVMAYGPVVGEHHHSAMFGPQGNALQPFDVAVSPNLGLNLGDWIQVNGKSHRVADWSFLKPGVPTKNTVEVRDGPDQGRGTLNRVNLTRQEIQNRISEFPTVAGEPTKQAVGEAGKAQGNAGMFSDLIPSATGTPTTKPQQQPQAGGAGIFSDLVPAQTPQLDEPPPQAAPSETPEELPMGSTITPSASLTTMPTPQPGMMSQIFSEGLQAVTPPQTLDRPLVPAEYMPPYLIAKGAEAILPQNPATQVYEGEMKGVADLMSSFTSPESLGMLAAGGAMGKLATRLVGGAFSAQAAARSPDAWKRFNETDDPQEKTRIAIGVIAGIGLPLAAWASRSPKIQKQIQTEVAKTTAELPTTQPVVEPPSQQAQAERPAPQIAGPAGFSVDMPTDAFATEHTPVASALINDIGGVVSKSAAHKSGRLEGNTDLWDDAPRMSHPTHNKIYNPLGEMPDTAANALYDAGLISEPSTQAMWNALDKESKSARSLLKTQRGAAQASSASLKEQAGQTEAFAQAEQQEWQGGASAVPVRDLQVGDTVTVKGEQLNVTDIDPDTYDVTLEDGRKFGVQTVSDNTVIYGEHEALNPPPEFSETKGAPPSPPILPPTGAAPPGGQMPETTLNELVNPVRGSGRFVRSYRIDKELGDKMEAIGNAKEAGAVRSELQSRNLLGELSPLREKELGQYLVSDRLKSVNPTHPQVLPDREMRRIESDPAIAKALDYYKREIKPDIEGWRKRAGLSEAAAAGKSAQFISLITKSIDRSGTPQLLGDKLVGNQSTRRLSRTTRFAKAASGEASEYDTDLRNILRESYGEAIRAAHSREFFKMVKDKGVAPPSRVFTPSGWRMMVQDTDLPPELQYDLRNATVSDLPPIGGAKFWRGIQSTVTGAALTANPPEILNHMRRQLNLVAAKPPLGMGVMARLEWLAPYFGPKLGAFKRASMADANSPQFQETLTRIFDAGGGSTRSFGEAYGSKIPGLKQTKEFTNRLLFGIPKGKGVMGWDLRMRVQLENMREAAEGNRDPQRIRENANQIGEYGRHNSWLTRIVKVLNPYGGTTVPMRITELKTAIGMSGFKDQPLTRAARLNAETFLRGTGGTILALSAANYLLSGKWPWQNDKGHEFDLNTGHQDKDGKQIYVKIRAIAPELSRPISTVSFPEFSRERTAEHPEYGVASVVGPTNQILSLLSGPAQNAALTAATGYVPYMLKRPGEAMELMDIARLTKDEREAGKSRFVKQLKSAALGVNPFGEAFGDRFHVEVPGGLGYIEEPIRGIKPFGRIFSSSYERAGDTSMVVPPPPPAPPPPAPP